MKSIHKIFTIAALISLTSTINAQEENEPLAPIVNDDTTKIKLGNMTIIFGDEDEDDFDFEEEEDEESSSIGLKGEFNVGMNGWLNTSNSTTFSSEYEPMSLALNRSAAFSLALKVDGLDLFKGHLFISPGLAITRNNYHFENKQMQISTGGDTTMFLIDSAFTFDKYKLRASYFEIPLTVGARIGKIDDTHFTIEAGVIGGININSIVKQRYYIDEVKYKNKVKDDFNINPFKLDAIASMKIGSFGIFGRYSLTSMFENNKTQEVYPFTLGITLGGI